MIAALVPVKRLVESKSRLLLPEAGLAPAQRKALTLAMLADVLEALGACRAVGERAVVTPDEGVARAARRLGARAIVYRERGLNRALQAGASALALADSDGLLVVLGDVADACPAELDRLCEAAAGPGGRAAMAAARDGGTAALVRRPHDALPACFGPDSAQRHREAAGAAGVPLVELALPSLAIDLDRADDLRDFMARTAASGASAAEAASGGASGAQAAPGRKPAATGRRTRAVLTELGWRARR